jgi:hypothetical protein
MTHSESQEHIDTPDNLAALTMGSDPASLPISEALSEIEEWLEEVEIE